MALTPSEVEQKTFSTALRGYDLDEVDDFLDEVVATLTELQDQLTEARTAKPAPAPAPPQPAPAIDESAVGRVLVTAQETADQIVADAQKEAEAIVAEAKVEVDTWSSEKEEKKAQAEAEMAQLSEHVTSVRSRLAVLATAVADKLDEMDGVISGDETTDSAEEPDVEEAEPASLQTAGESGDTDEVSDTEPEDFSSRIHVVSSEGQADGEAEGENN